MVRRNNKVCHTCTKEYKYCTGCSEYDHLPRWMALFHNDNCRVIFNIVSSYCAGHIDQKSAAEQLIGCDLSYKDTMKPGVISKINEILEVKEETVEDFEVIKEESLGSNDSVLESNIAECVVDNEINELFINKDDNKLSENDNDVVVDEIITYRSKSKKIRPKKYIEE